MYVNQIDELFDNILNDFYNFLIKEKFFEKVKTDTNFVKFQYDILNTIKKFTNNISKNDILNIIKNKSYYESILNIIKRYCAFYIYLGIAYHYTGNRDLYITNIIEASKYQKDATFQIANFFNSENNSKIIVFYNDIKNFLSLLELKTVDKIKIILSNNVIKYESTIKLFNDLGEEYVVEYFIETKDNFHNIMKSLIFKQIYLKEDKNEIYNMLNQNDKENAEYKYIEIIVSNEKKIVDFNVIQKFLNILELKSGLAEEIYEYIEEFKNTKEIVIKENQDFINYLFANQIIIPITEDFLRYHKNTEKYDTDEFAESNNMKDRDATKIKYIINKMNNVKNYHSLLLDKNPKQKIETEKLFFKPLDPKMATLYNDDEEIRIIQKLEISDNAVDYDLLIDLENIRKYSYVNFKNLSKDGIKISPLKTIQGVRYTNFNYKKNQNKQLIETRIGNDNINMNIVGIIWNPSKTPLDCFKIIDIVDVREKLKDENGYNAFIKTMEQTFGESKKKLYSWIFDNSKDKLKLETYINYNENESQRNIKIMIEEIYKKYIKMVENKIDNYINNTEEFSMWSLHNILKEYTKKYFDFNLYPEIKNRIIENIIINKIPELPIEPDDIDSMIPGRRDKIIPLPVLKLIESKENIIELDRYEIDVSLEMSKKNLPICHHYIKWKNIMKISKKSDDFNQSVFNFVKQYIKLNKRGDYVCKSCNEQVQIQKFVVEGTYIEELDTFLTTSMTVTQNLEELPKYSKYKRTIRNIEKNIEKFAYSMELNNYIGNTPVIKLRRKIIIKDVIDLILIHTEWLRNQSKDRIEQFSKKYGIEKELTNLFFFELTDDIFLTSSLDTDYYKIIKYNNIVAYIIVIIITEMNSGQILYLKEDKIYNYYLFEKISQNLFGNLYLRKNEKEKIEVNKYPLFAYILYYVSGIMVSNRLWLYNDNDIEPKQKPMFMINIQKTIINTVIDLINSLVEANFELNKNFLYEIINERIRIKLRYTFNDEQLLARIITKSMKNINIDQTTKKITFLTKKVEVIGLNYVFNMNEPINNSCDVASLKLDKKLFKTDANDIDILTNCPDGKFHNWEFKSGDLNCNFCKKSYNDLIKIISTTSTEKTSNEYLDKIKLINLKKLFKKFCISADTHEIDNLGKCSKCNIIVDDWNPSDKELKRLETNLEVKTNELSIQQINEMRNYNNKLKVEDQKTKQILNDFTTKYNNETNNNLESYIEKFMNRLIKILGPKIKSQNKTIYIKDTVYIVDHDYFGNIIKEPFYILSSDDKIILINKHPSFNKDVLYYKDKSNKVYVYYDPITYQYLGYSEDNKNIKKIRNNVSLKIELSIKDNIMYLGYENKYYNIYHINKEYQTNLPKKLGTDSKDVILNILRDRINNLKQIIFISQSMIYNVKNNNQIISEYNIEEKNIISEFTKKITKFETSNESENNIFKDSNKLIHNLHINYNIPENLNVELNNNYLDINNINSLSNSDFKLIFYLIFNFNELLDYNKQSIIQSELAHLIIKIIKYSFNLYYIPYSNYNIRKFDYLLINESAYIDETIKVVGHYQELLNQNEINDQNNQDDIYSAQEAFDSLDIDDYEKNDDIDYSAEALDGYE